MFIPLRAMSPIVGIVSVDEVGDCNSRCSGKMFLDFWGRFIELKKGPSFQRIIIKDPPNSPTKKLSFETLPDGRLIAQVLQSPAFHCWIARKPLHGSLSYYKESPDETAQGILVRPGQRVEVGLRPDQLDGNEYPHGEGQSGVVIIHELPEDKRLIYTIWLRNLWYRVRSVLLPRGC